MEVMGWRAHYGEGVTIASSEVDSWLDLPSKLPGVVEFLEPPYRREVSGGDWLWMEDGRWHTSGTVWEGWVEKPHPQAIRGRAMADEQWAALQEQMLADREWPDA